MIVSHQLGTVFVKTRKTAGTSVELSLSTVCGPDDIITPVTAEDERLRHDIGGRGPQHHLTPWWAATPRQWAAMMVKRHRPLRFYNHMAARDALRHLGHDLWDGYFTFTIERNPWDKAVSRYYWEASRRPVPSFSEFLRECPRHLLTCFDLYSDGDGRVIVDQVVRYERLTDELREVWRRLGITPAALPRAKATHRPERDYRDMFNDEDAALVATVCSREIANLGYRF